jgi:hypothetical protein
LDLAQFAGVIGVFMVASACGVHQVQVTDGSDLAAGDAAQLEIEAGLVIDAIDGDTSLRGASTEQRPLTIHVKPGRHTLTLRYKSQSAVDQKIMQTITTTESDPLEFEISVDRGATYSVYRTVNGDLWWPHIRRLEPADG